MEHQRRATPDDASPEPGQIAGPQWTPGQLERLENEWRRLQRSFAYHPAVRVVPLSGNPPTEYQVEFQARTLHVREDGQLDYLSTPAIHIWLGPNYPHEAPLVRPIQAIFHPNVVAEGILLAPAWQPTMTLVDVVRQVGELITYRTYDAYNAWNPAAMEWTNANAAYLPTDPAAEFDPAGHGDPLERICRNGTGTIAQLRQQLDELCTSMLRPSDPPSAEEVRAFARQIRLALTLFFDDDVPDSIREGARMLDEWAQGLPQTVMCFEGLRQRHIASAAALQAAGKVAEARRALLKELGALEKMTDAAPRSAAEALGVLPDSQKLQAALAGLRVVTSEAQKRLAAARARLAALAPPEPRGLQTLSDLLEVRIGAEIELAGKTVQDALEKTRAAVETIAPTVDRAAQELVALQRIIAWRDFADLTDRARGLVDQIITWGAAGVQAYYMSNDGGAFGPFEFDQRLDFGDWALAVRNTGRTAIEVWDLTIGKRLGASETGQITVSLKGAGDARYPTAFAMTARCDELWIQLDYLTRQIGELLVKQAKPVALPQAQSWVANFDRLLSGSASINEMVAQTRSDVQKRKALVQDLKALARFKERLTTQFLLERHCDVVPQLRQEMLQAQKHLAEANERIAYIFARSQRDLETNQPMVPPKFAKDYEINKNKRDQAQLTIERAQRLMDVAVQQIVPRLTTPTLYGADDLPLLTILPGLPDEIAARSEVISEDAIAQQIALLEDNIGVQLRPDVPASTQQAVVDRPADVVEAGLVDQSSNGQPHEGEALDGEQPPAAQEFGEPLAAEDTVASDAAPAHPDAFDVEDDQHSNSAGPREQDVSWPAPPPPDKPRD